MIQRFLEYIKVEKKYSQNTILSYKHDLESFICFLQKTEGTEDTLTADKKMVRNFIAWLSQNKLSKRSINRKLSSLRCYFLFLVRIGEIKSSPLETIPSLKFYPEKQSPMSEKEMDRVMQIVSPKENLLEWLIIEILYQTGIRRAELCGLLLKNVNFHKKELKIIGKGNKTRLVPISENLLQNIEKYTQEERNPIPEAQNYLLVTPKGKKLYEKFVYSVVNSYLSRVTLKNKKSPHMLRHSFATHILNNGAEISKVKSLMGHSSLSSTQVYTHADIEQLKKILRNAHPRSKEVNISLTNKKLCSFMKISVQAIGLTPHQPLEEFIDKKLSKLDTFYDKILECKVVLRVENHSEKENKTSELIVVIPGDDIVVKKTTISFEESIDLCVDTAKKLLIKKKETER